MWWLNHHPLVYCVSFTLWQPFLLSEYVKCISHNLDLKQHFSFAIQAIDSAVDLILHKICFLTLSDFRTYIYVRNSQTVATPVRIYTYTDFSIETWGFNRRLTDTLRYHHTIHTRCSCASGLQLAAILHQVNQRKKGGVYSELSAVFGKFWENYDCRTKLNSSLGMEYNGALYGFSAVKVKLVDSLIWWPFIPGWIRPRTPMTRPFDTCASFYFEQFVL